MSDKSSIKKDAVTVHPTDFAAGEVLTKLATGQSKIIDNAALEALHDYQPGSALEKKLVRKADLLLIPTLWLMCVLCFMDRSNIGNANAAGMGHDLGLSDTNYSMLITVFFIAYCIWEVPSNLILTRCPRPSLYLPGLMIVWGAIVCAMSSMESYGHVLVCRVFLAIIEAGFPPGVLYIMSTWYKKNEIGKRWCLFYTAICFSGAASGLISGAVISGLEGVNGRRGWRWLFLIEGIVTIAVAICAAFVLPDYPHTPSKRFSEEERRLAIARMLHDRAETANKKKLTPIESVKAALVDLRLYLYVAVFILQNGSTTVSYFIPTVLASMGYHGTAQQWMTVPVWATGVVFLLVFPYVSDRVGNRHWFVVGGLSTGFLSAIICVSVHIDVVRYVFLCFYIAGLYMTYPLVLNWASETINQPAEKRAIVIAFVNSAGSLSSIYGGYIWPSADAPEYKTGFITVSVFIGLALTIAIFLPLISRYLPKFTTKAERELED
ncbi:retrograde regulation protein 2 [Hypoxylon crocopeplum]|nr:retrograde regulation protein 2 [Hypoxylon crocopeplum]